jgi:hypothetical protein
LGGRFPADRYLRRDPKRRYGMKKRSAMLIAAGLVVALAIGAAAMSLSLGTTASAEGSRARPIVKTVRDTVTIHKKAKGSSDGPTVVTLQSSSAAEDFEEALEEAMDDTAEHEGDDDGFEHEDHEDEDHEDEHDLEDDD